jgi:8-oxo-dGTP diphosphatase
MPKTDQGVQPGRYMLIPRTLTFIFRGDEVLLLKGAPHKRLWANKFNGVGGHVERGEDILSAARREIHEETGLDIDPLVLCGTVIVDTGEEVGIGIYVFRGEYASGELVPSAEGDLAWVPVNRLEDYPLVEDIPLLVQKALQQARTGVVFAARYRYDSAGRLVIFFG